MVKEFTKERQLVNRNFPIMRNFPFNEDFEISLESSPMLAVMFDDEFDSGVRRPAKNLHFRHVSSPLKVTISITPTEMAWLSQVAESIKKLDRIAKKIDRGLRSKDVLVKRDASMEADLWLSQLTDGTSSLSQETVNEVLKSLLGNKTVPQTVRFINDLNKLYAGTGLVRLSSEDLNVMFTYFHFKLIYAKLMLGIIISSKISI